jgi:hypothetical protein
MQTKSNKKITEQPGVMPTEEEGLKNWVAFFWGVTACVLKDKVSEETTVYIFRVEGRVRSQPVYCADIYRERRYQMLC